MNMPIVETFLTIVLAAGAAVFGAVAAMCWLRERGLVSVRAILPRSRKAMVRLALASLFAAGAVRYGGSKGIRESGGMEGQPPSISVDGGQEGPALRSGDEPHFAAIMPTNDCMLLRIALPREICYNIHR